MKITVNTNRKDISIVTDQVKLHSVIATPYFTERANEMLALLLWKCSSRSGKKMPKLKEVPSRRKKLINDANMTTQLHPPSGGKPWQKGSRLLFPGCFILIGRFLTWKQKQNNVIFQRH